MPLTALAVLGAMFWLATGPQPARRPAHPTSTTASTAVPAAPAPVAAAESGSDTEPVELSDPTTPLPQGLETFYAQKAAWGTCAGASAGDTDQCATVSVPVDYLDPRGETVRIALRRLPATHPDQRRGTLFVNPGGPGASGVEMVDQAPDYFSESIRGVWDVVGFDPRGIGGSGGFTCMRPRDLDAMYASDPTPETAAERRALDRARVARLAGCLERGGPLARAMGSEQVAKDLDILRAAVGDTHLNYYGISYGTLIGALYAAQFPDRVGYTVIDSAVDPDYVSSSAVTQDDIDYWAEQSAGEADSVFADFVDSCVEDGDCPLGDDHAVAARRLVAFLDRLDRTPMPTDEPGIPVLTEGWAATGLAGAMRDQSMWGDAVEALRSALEDDDGSGLLWLAEDAVSRDSDGTYYGGYESVHLPIHCADWPSDASTSMRPTAKVLAAHPLYAHLFAEVQDSCAAWSGTQRTHLVITADPTTPVLVLGNEGDLTTPLDQTQRMAHAIFGSRFVSVVADGHGVYDNGNDCADAIVENYLVRSLVPKDGAHCA
ncbi:alpha/beta hydrolase [Intrasporangium flavum]|uniref:alpha/beta hydrolase n=1 Tax=Intrasporangium flavum TaxID=1428657 RepID=UPI00096D756B|nr:alpha/beta hydrolase [Intrasporangium flavum]